MVQTVLDDRSGQVTCGKEKTHGNIVKCETLGEYTKKWRGGEYIKFPLILVWQLQYQSYCRLPHGLKRYSLWVTVKPFSGSS